MPSTFQNLPCTTRSRLVHAWLLLLWLLSSHAFGALLIMAVAGITGDHTLKQCASHHGEVGLVLGHSSRNVSHGQEGLGREAVADASQTSQLEKPDHFFHLRSVEEAAADSRRIAPNGPSMVLLPARWVLSDFRARLILTNSIISSSKQTFRRTIVGLHVKASMTILRC